MGDKPTAGRWDARWQGGTDGRMIGSRTIEWPNGERGLNVFDASSQATEEAGRVGVV